MAVISQSSLERIRAASDIVDVIGAYLPLKRAGANFVALCPFHKEKTPSFNVNPHQQIFHCFGCHKGGDVFSFVKEYENTGFVDAVRRLAERAKIPLDLEGGAGEQHARHVRDHLLEIHEKIAQRWQNCLLNEAAGQAARDYLSHRGVSAEAVKLFRLGAAPESWDDTVNWAKSKNYELPLVEKAGLIIRKAEEGKVEGGRYYDRFRGRLMFPICDELGKVVGFSGRILSGEKEPAKYINSPETPIFTKGKMIYGLDKSRRAMLDAGFAIICEGQLDLIACFMAGVQNVAAPQGTAFTEQHARILKRYANEVVLCFDSDEAGQNAAVRSLDQLIASGLAVRVAVIPAPHDPDSFIKSLGGDKFRELIQDAAGFFDYYLNRLCRQNDAGGDKGRLAILLAMGETVHKTGNAVLIDTYAQKTALRLGVSPDAVRSVFARAQTSQPRAQAADGVNSEPEVEMPDRPSQDELWLLKLLLRHDELAEPGALHLDSDWVAHPLARQIIERRLAAHRDKTWNGLAPFLDACDSAEMRNLVTEAAAEERKIPNPETQLPAVILKLRNQFLDTRIGAVIQKVALPQTSDEERIELLRQRETLRQQRSSPLAASARR